MSLLTACQLAVQETGIGDAPSSIIGSSDRTAVQLLALAKREAKVLAVKNWQAMMREQTITMVSGTSGYSLPADWARYVSDTFWDTTNYWQMRGSIDPATWQALRRGIVAGQTIRKEFRVVGNLVQIYPSPTNSTDVVIGEYLRNTPWIDSTLATYRTAPSADTDTTVFPERLLELGLIWRWMKAKGLDYSEERDTYEREVAIAFAQDVPAKVIDFSTSDRQAFVPNIPQNIPT